VVGDPFLVVEKEFLDYVGLVAQAQDEVLVAVVGVVLHQVPEDRPVADLHHRLRDLTREFSKTSAQAAAEQDDLHRPFTFATEPRKVARRSPRASAGPTACWKCVAALTWANSPRCGG